MNRYEIPDHFGKQSMVVIQAGLGHDSYYYSPRQKAMMTSR